MRTFSLAALFLLALPGAAQTGWQRLPLLEHSRYPCFAIDAMRGEAVLFGGEFDGGRSDATWTWDHSQWRRREPLHRPPARQQAAMVFDAQRGVVLLFGGRDGNTVLGDTWSWDGVDWTQLLPSNAPSARSLHAMVFDAARGTVLLFGGRPAASGELADTWEWNGSDWTQRAPVHSPPGRTGAAMAGDLLRQRVVLFGGSCFQLGPCWRADTWEWDGVDWTDRTPAYPLPSPEPRWSHGMAYDPLAQRTLVFAGSDEPAHYKDDLWQWDGTAWVEVVSATRPVGRLGFGMDFDLATGAALAFGGESWMGLRSDLWRFDGVDWQLACAPMLPRDPFLERTETATYDGDRGVVLWFGLDYDAALPQQTWQWDGQRWWLVQAGQGPRWPEHHALGWLPTLHGVVLYQPWHSALQGEQTLAWDGVQWWPLQPQHQPGVLSGYALGLDPRLDRLLLFGGRDGQGLRASTWTFDGFDWVQLAATGPSAREGHAMALDLRRRRAVLFGGRDGNGRCGDTWEWDGQQWLLRQPANAPSPRQDHAMTYDLSRQRTVLHGGSAAGGDLADTWEWDGGDWTLRQVVGPRDVFHSLVYDLGREESILVGGIASGTFRYAALQRGTVAFAGSPCGGSLGVPALRAPLGERPCTGGAFALQASNLPGSVAIGVLGGSDLRWNGLPLPLDLAPFGYPGCMLRVEPLVLVGLPVGNGVCDWSLSLPSSPSLVGLALFQQVLAPDPQGSSGLAATPAARLLIGGR